MISFNDFKKLDIRICQITSVERIAESKKLLKIMFDTGTENRQIIAGMAPFFDDLDALTGLKMPVLLNIEPATFVGHESQGMIIVADDAGRPIFLVPAEDIPIGTLVK